MRRALFAWSVLLAIAAAVALTSLSMGSLHLDAHALVRAYSDGSDPAHAVLMGLRVPRVANGFVIGALLAISGALLQVLLRNPLAEPYVLGLSGGAALGALCAISASLGTWWIAGGAWAGALLSLAALMALAYREFVGSSPRSASDRLLLCGVVLSAQRGA